MIAQNSILHRLVIFACRGNGSINFQLLTLIFDSFICIVSISVFFAFFDFQKSIPSIRDIWFDREFNSALTGNVFIALELLCKFIFNNFNTPLISIESRHGEIFCFFSNFRNRFSLYVTYGLMEK